jgi:hypothetical protein
MADTTKKPWSSKIVLISILEIILAVIGALGLLAPGIGHILTVICAVLTIILRCLKVLPISF